MVNKTDCPMFLGIIRSTQDWMVHPKKLKTKSNPKVGVVHGITEGEKRRLSKETRPVAN